MVYSMIDHFPSAVCREKDSDGISWFSPRNININGFSPSEQCRQSNSIIFFAQVPSSQGDLRRSRDPSHSQDLNPSLGHSLNSRGDRNSNQGPSPSSREAPPLSRDLRTTRTDTSLDNSPDSPLLSSPGILHLNSPGNPHLSPGLSLGPSLNLDHSSQGSLRPSPGLSLTSSNR